MALSISIKLNSFGGKTSEQHSPTTVLASISYERKNVHRLDNLAVIKYPVFIFLVFSLDIIKGIEKKRS